MNKLTLTFGADPELMLQEKETGRMVNSIPVLKHNKHDPISLGDGIKMYSDNVLVETSFPPSHSREGFISRLRQALQRMTDKIGPKYRLEPKAAHVYDFGELGPKPKSMVGELPVEWEIGCNPNFDVYARAPRIPEPFADGLRTGSFHVHVGNDAWKSKQDKRLLDMTTKEHAIKLLDIYLGCSSVIFDNDPTSLARRALYGKAGEFRPTPYGVEYRCLSNYALRSPDLASLVIDLTEFAMKFIEDGTSEDVIRSVDESIVRKAINHNNKGFAAAILARSGLSDSLWARVQKEYKPNFKAEWQLN
jgi:hypothetical protein